MIVSELLAGVSPRNGLATVDAPEAGEGATATFRTRLSVADVLALPENFPSLPAFVQNTLLFRLLVRDPSGASPNLSDDEFAGMDALYMSQLVERAGLRGKVFEQLSAAKEDAEPKGKPGP